MPDPNPSRHDPNTNRFVAGIFAFIAGVAMLIPAFQRGAWEWALSYIALTLFAVWLMVSSAIVYFRSRKGLSSPRLGEGPALWLAVGVFCLLLGALGVVPSIQRGDGWQIGRDLAIVVLGVGLTAWSVTALLRSRRERRPSPSENPEA